MSLTSTWNCYDSIAHISDELRALRVSPVDLVAASLRQIERLQPELNAFITVAADSATQAAATAEREIKQGKWRGPLHGVPVAVKDFYDTAGIRTTAGFEPFKHRIPGRDAAAVARLKDAGAIILGKTNMHTLGMGTTGLESAFGPVKNPWNADFIAGGSSSGSAAAIASGLCWATLDTDAIGSCRLPAACCGVVGFKGTYSLIDMSGILEGEQPPGDDIIWLSHAAITARTVKDAALVLDALAERDGGARATSFADGLDHDADLRIGIADNLDPDPEVAEAFAQAAATIRGLGHRVSAAAAPSVDLGGGVGGIAADRRTVADRHFRDIDLIVLPTNPQATPRVETARANPLALPPDYTMFANYFGLPAISVPCGFDRRGLPLGLQIVGRPGEDASVLWMAHRYQCASGFIDRRPSV
ncbi:MAG: amidase [Bradyrhizobium sp.]|nr:MAG: amidase [Bradyrhizobium sp.]